MSSLPLSALPALRRPRSVRPLVYLQIALVVGVLSLGAVGMLVPSAVPSVPATGSPEAIALLVVGLALFSLLTWQMARNVAVRVTRIATVALRRFFPPSSMTWSTTSSGMVDTFDVTGVSSLT